ncbi:MAG TPA: hypothetical protein VK064_03295 [Wenzhouxiangella sp.]|nr:hypothetical protein [Wenzhouxiangella sp.]
MAGKPAGVLQKRLRLGGHQQQQLNATAESEELRQAAAPGKPAKKEDVRALKTTHSRLTVRKRRAAGNSF